MHGKILCTYLWLQQEILSLDGTEMPVHCIRLSSNCDFSLPVDRGVGEEQKLGLCGAADIYITSATHSVSTMFHSELYLSLLCTRAERCTRLHLCPRRLARCRLIPPSWEGSLAGVCISVCRSAGRDCGCQRTAVEGRFMRCHDESQRRRNG